MHNQLHMSTCCSHIVSHAATDPLRLHTQTKTHAKVAEASQYKYMFWTHYCSMLLLPFWNIQQRNKNMVQGRQHWAFILLLHILTKEKINKRSNLASLKTLACEFIFFFFTHTHFFLSYPPVRFWKFLHTKKQKEKQNNKRIKEKWLHNTFKHGLMQTEHSVLRKKKLLGGFCASDIISMWKMTVIRAKSSTVRCNSGYPKNNQPTNITKKGRKKAKL